MRETNRRTQGNQRGSTPSNVPHWIDDPHEADPSTRFVRNPGRTPSLDRMRSLPPDRPIRPSGGSQIAKLIPRPSPPPPPEPEPERGWSVLATGAGLSAVALLGTGVVSTGVILLALILMPMASGPAPVGGAARPASPAAAPTAGVLPPLGAAPGRSSAATATESRSTLAALSTPPATALATSPPPSPPAAALPLDDGLSAVAGAPATPSPAADDPAIAMLESLERPLDPPARPATALAASSPAVAAPPPAPDDSWMGALSDLGATVTSWVEDATTPAPPPSLAAATAPATRAAPPSSIAAAAPLTLDDGMAELATPPADPVPSADDPAIALLAGLDDPAPSPRSAPPPPVRAPVAPAAEAPAASDDSWMDALSDLGTTVTSWMEDEPAPPPPSLAAATAPVAPAAPAAGAPLTLDDGIADLVTPPVEPGPSADDPALAMLASLDDPIDPIDRSIGKPVDASFEARPAPAVARVAAAPPAPAVDPDDSWMGALSDLGATVTGWIDDEPVAQAPAIAAGTSVRAEPLALDDGMADLDAPAPPPPPSADDPALRMLAGLDDPSPARPAASDPDDSWMGALSDLGSTVTGWSDDAPPEPLPSAPVGPSAARVAAGTAVPDLSTPTAQASAADDGGALPPARSGDDDSWLDGLSELGASVTSMMPSLPSFGGGGPSRPAPPSTPAGEPIAFDDGLDMVGADLRTAPAPAPSPDDPAMRMLAELDDPVAAQEDDSWLGALSDLGASIASAVEDPGLEPLPPGSVTRVAGDGDWADGLSARVAPVTPLAAWTSVDPAVEWSTVDGTPTGASAARAQPWPGASAAARPGAAPTAPAVDLLADDDGLVAIATVAPPPPPGADDPALRMLADLDRPAENTGWMGGISSSLGWDDEVAAPPPASLAATLGAAPAAPPPPAEDSWLDTLSGVGTSVASMVSGTPAVATTKLAAGTGALPAAPPTAVIRTAPAADESWLSAMSGVGSSIASYVSGTPAAAPSLVNPDGPSLSAVLAPSTATPSAARAGAVRPSAPGTPAAYVATAAPSAPSPTFRISPPPTPAGPVTQVCPDELCGDVMLLDWLDVETKDVDLLAGTEDDWLTVPAVGSSAGPVVVDQPEFVALAVNETLRTHTLRIRVDAQDVPVEVDGQAVGIAPLTQTVSPGAHIVNLYAGYQPTGFMLNVVSNPSEWCFEARGRSFKHVPCP